MRTVICNGVLWDADDLPPHVDASACVPQDEWFAANKQPTTNIVADGEPAAPSKAKRPK